MCGIAGIVSLDFCEPVDWVEVTCGESLLVERLLLRYLHGTPDACSCKDALSPTMFM